MSAPAAGPRRSPPPPPPRAMLVLPCRAPATEQDFERLAIRLRRIPRADAHAPEARERDGKMPSSPPSPPAAPPAPATPPRSAAGVGGSFGCSMSAARQLRGCHVASVPGLRLIYDVVTPEEEVAALAALEADRGTPANNIHTATQWGWRFSTWNRTPPLRADDKLAPLPAWQRALVAALLRADPARRLLPSRADWGRGVEHALLNCYQPGDGVAPHTDDQHFWTGWVLGLSLGSDVTMLFHPPATGADAALPARAAAVAVRLPARSLYVLSGESRWAYRHEIVRAGADWVAGEAVPRGYRVSVTWRGISDLWLPRSLAHAPSDDGDVVIA